MNRRDCPHRRTSVVTEERYDPLFGIEVPTESTVFRICDDCGKQLGMVADTSIVVADDLTASLYGEPCV